MQSLELKIFSMQNPISKADFEKFYALLEASFPQGELRTKAAFWELCESSKFYKIFTLFKDSELVALFTVWEFRSFSFGDHFAVSPNARCGGIGTRLLNEVTKNCLSPFVLEVELPEDELSKRRLNFYLRNGFNKNSQEYILPPMQEGFEAIPMHILSYPTLVGDSDFDKIKDKIYKEVYGIK